MLLKDWWCLYCVLDVIMSCQNDSQCQNGGLCGLRDVRNGSCNCNAGWTGEHCESKTSLTSYSRNHWTGMHSSRMRTARSSSRQLWRGALPQCMLDTSPVWVWRPPQVWAWRPPGCGTGDLPCMGLETPRCGPGDPPGCGPGDPLGVGLETPPSQTPQAPPWVLAWKPARHAGIHILLETCKACWDTTCGQNSWHTLLKILPCPNFLKILPPTRVLVALW